MELSKAKAIKEHRKMWNWIADETYKTEECVDKCDYLNHNKECKEMDKRYNLSEHFNCFCCAYAGRNNSSFAYERCENCPLHWGDNRCFDDSYFHDWGLACQNDDWETAYKLARKIANLPKHHVGKHWHEKM